MDVTRDKLVYGENISMATQFVATGAAQVGRSVGVSRGSAAPFEQAALVVGILRE